MHEIKLGVFVDVQNIYYTVKEKFGRQFNYHQLWHRLNADVQIVIANAYAIDRGDAQQRKFQSALRHIGFEIKLKPYIERHDGSRKGDWDVGITIDMIQAAPAVDKVVLLSGDGDFALLLLHLREFYSCPSEVISVTDFTAQALLKACDKHSPIDYSLLL